MEAILYHQLWMSLFDHDKEFIASHDITRCWSADKQKIVVISVVGESLLTGNVSLKLWPIDGPASGNKPIKKFPAHGSELQQVISLDENHFMTSAAADRLVNIW